MSGLALLGTSLGFPVLAESAASAGFWAGLWHGVFQLAALGLVAIWVKGVWQRFRERHAARRELIDEIDRFSVALYSPRKLYQTLIDGNDEWFLACLPEGEAREKERVRVLRDSLDGLIDAIGRFRALQVKVVPLYGFHVEIFAHYVAIWLYLKELRERMRHMKSLRESDDALAERPGTRGGGDDLYRLIDAFRFHVMTQRARTHPPRKMHLSQEFLDNVHVLASKLYRHYFGSEPVAGSGNVGDHRRDKVAAGETASNGSGAPATDPGLASTATSR